jgi:LEA14-like dessication related protein
MSGDKEDAIGSADTDAVNLKGGKVKSQAPPKKKGWSTMRKVVVLGFIIFLVVVIPVAATMQMPAVDVVGAEIHSTGSGLQKTYTLYATVQVGNPNAVSVTVTHISGKFYVNGAYGGDFSRTDSVTIVAQGTTEFNVQVTIQNTVPIHLSQDNPVRVKGTVTIQGALTSWDVPFDDTRDVHVP